jgi:hypothetical protein
MLSPHTNQPATTKDVQGVLIHLSLYSSNSLHFLAWRYRYPRSQLISQLREILVARLLYLFDLRPCVKALI